MTGDYERGFDAGFAAALHAGAGQSKNPTGYADEKMAGGQKRIAISFASATFNYIAACAQEHGRSFAAEVRELVSDGIKHRDSQCPKPEDVRGILSAHEPR